MSNKTRLQTNNTNLQGLIDKANSLPEAGGGGSSGGVETCYCQIHCNAPSLDSCTVTYTNANMQLETKTFEIMNGTSIELVKGTIITLSTWTSSESHSENCVKILASYYGGAYFIGGDSIIIYN